MASKWAKQRSSDPLVLPLSTNIAMEEEVLESTVDGVLIRGVICEPRFQVNVAVTP